MGTKMKQQTRIMPINTNVSIWTCTIWKLKHPVWKHGKEIISAVLLYLFCWKYEKEYRNLENMPFFVFGGWVSLSLTISNWYGAPWSSKTTFLYFREVLQCWCSMWKLLAKVVLKPRNSFLPSGGNNWSQQGTNLIQINTVILR